MSIADVADALDRTHDPLARALLQRLALLLIEGELVRRRIAVLRAALCGHCVDGGPGGGDDERHDGAAA